MKTKKILAAILIALAIGIGFYGAQYTARSRQQQEASERQNALLVEQIRQLQRERDEATNRLTAAGEEIAALKSQQNTTEILRLRGEVGRLRQQLAFSEARAQPSFGGLAQMLSDPVMKNHIRQNSLLMTQSIFSDLFKELKLTPEQAQKAAQLLSDSMLNQAEKLYSLPQGSVSPDELGKMEAGWAADLAKELQPLLGDKGVARFKQVREEIPAHATVELLKGRLGANQLSDDQNNRLLQIVKAEPFDLTRGIAGISEPAFWGSQADIDEHLAKLAESNQHILDQASSFLTPDQVDGLNAVLTNGINTRLAQAAAFIPKR